MQLSQPPPVSDTRVNDWLYRLWKAVNENTQDIAVLEAGGGGGGDTINNYVTQSLTAQDGQDGWTIPAPVSAPPTWLLSFSAAHG